MSRRTRKDDERTPAEGPRPAPGADSPAQDFASAIGNQALARQLARSPDGEMKPTDDDSGYGGGGAEPPDQAPEGGGGGGGSAGDFGPEVKPTDEPGGYD